MCGGQIFRGSERKLTSGQDPKIWGKIRNIISTGENYGFGGGGLPEEDFQKIC